MVTMSATFFSFFTFLACLSLGSVRANLGFDPTPGKTYKVGNCNICGGDGFLQNTSFKFNNGGKQWTCGYAQQTVQDVRPASSQSEAEFCNKMTLIAQQGGCPCRGGNDLQAVVNKLGEECHLCGRGISVANRDTLTNTGAAGKHRCDSLANYMLTGGISKNLCPTIKQTSYNDCCVKTTSTSYGTGGVTPQFKPQYNTASNTGTAERKPMYTGLRGGLGDTLGYGGAASF